MCISFIKFITYTSPPTQWYKVYQDPEGTHSLEKTDDIDAANTQKFISNGTDDSFYKSRIMSLNEEIIDLNKTIKALNDELAMVGEYQMLLYAS